MPGKIAPILSRILLYSRQLCRAINHAYLKRQYVFSMRIIGWFAFGTARMHGEVRDFDRKLSLIV
jgi:hypothetical protein